MQTGGALLALGALAGLSSLVFAFTNFLKFLSAKDYNAVMTQIEVWVAGLAGVFLVGATQFAASVPVTNSQSLSDMSGWSKVMIGLLVSSGASTFNEFKKAKDNTDTGRTPPLIPSLSPLAKEHHSPHARPKLPKEG